MNLLQWHKRLAQHFTELSEQRAAKNVPVFALEHGISSEEVIQLKQAIQDQLAVSAPALDSWLPWVAYAAEIGYEFDGHEFWQTFEEETSYWTLHGDRHFIKDCFIRFVEFFGGFKPSGIWANHFNIICYPVTHAILPKDLQRQLAKILYDLRFQFNHTFLQSTEQLGNRIASHCESATKRFQQFSQNIELTGIIARELLTHDRTEIPNIILPAALQRIVADLRKERDASSWLDEARTVAHTHAQRDPKSRSPGDRSDKLRLEPALLLRPVGQKIWDLYIEIPDLLPLAEQSTELFDFLSTSGPRIKGSFFDRRLARSSLVSYGAIQEKLGALPNESDELLIFRREKPTALDHFLRNEFKLKIRDINLFKIQNDGLAHQQHSMIVRADGKYLILARRPLSDDPLIKVLGASLENAYLYSLTLPETVSGREERYLNALGLNVKQNVAITPVGAVAAYWDGDSYIEFLADDRPCLAIEFDQELESLCLEYADEKIQLQKPPLSQPIFINLPQLPIGSYDFTVSAKKPQQFEFDALETVEIVIREPRARQSPTTNQNVLLLLTDPYKPSFEQLFAGKVIFDILTPPDTQVDLYLTLLNKDRETAPKFRKKLYRLNLPGEAEKLNSLIFEALREKSTITRAEAAHACCLEFEADEYGTVRIDFEREILSLRWSAETDRNNQLHLKLSDYSDSGEILFVENYEFGFPDRRKLLPYAEVNSEYGFPVPRDGGGLFVAKAAQARHGIVVLRQLEQSSFKSFAEIGQTDDFKPAFLRYQRSVESLLDLIGLYSLWSMSSSVGSAFRIGDLKVVENAWLLELVSLIDNEQNWRKAETQYRSNSVGSDFTLQKAVSNNSRLTRTLSGICRSEPCSTSYQWIGELVTALGDDVPQVKTKIERAGKMPHIKVIKREWFAEFALRLCSRPETLQKWADKKFELGLEKMLECPTLVRAARYIVLTANHRDRASDGRRSLKWDWE